MGKTKQKEVAIWQQEEARAILRDCPSSPRKMRLVVNAIRGIEVHKALGILRYTKNHASIALGRLLKSAISNWEQKNLSDKSALDKGLVHIKTITVDGGRMLKRLSPAPQGRAYRIRKRSNHVTIVLDKKEIQQTVA